MSIGPLFVGWERLTHYEADQLGLERWAGFWEAFTIRIGDFGWHFWARPERGIKA